MKRVIFVLLGVFCVISLPLYAEDSAKDSGVEYTKEAVNPSDGKTPTFEKETNFKSAPKESTPPAAEMKGAVQMQNVVPTQGPGLSDAALFQRANDLFPFPTAEECAAYRRRADQLQELLRRRDYAPLTAREEARSQWCEEQAREEALVQADERARAQQELDRASQACMSLRTEIQRTVDERNAGAQECSRRRQACLQAEDAYQSCVHDGGRSFLSFITFNAVNCNSEHTHRNNACASYTDAYQSISNLRQLNCDAFNAQTTNDSICGSRLNYYESNCAATHGNLESESRLAWYCERYVR